MAVRLSTKLKGVLPKRWTFPIRPKERAAGIPSKKETDPIVRTVFRRDHPLSSTKYAVITSSKEIPEVTAAMISRKKKRGAKKAPPGMALNTLVRERKTSPGPWSGGSPKAKIAGKIAKPAKMAMRVSRKVIITPEEAKLSFLVR